MGGGAGLAEGPSGQESGTAQLSETTCLPHVTSASSCKNLLHPPTPTPAPTTSTKRSREFSSPLNGMNLSWAQKELFIKCSWHSQGLYRAQPCSEAQQTTFFLKAQFIGQLQSPGPQSRARGSSLGIDIKGAGAG